MKKVLAIVSLAALLCSCQPTGQNGVNGTSDSVAVANVTDEEKAPEVAKSIFAHVADSIYKAHPGDINNEIIQEDIAKDLKKYALQFKGKHMPMIEEVPFKLTEVVQDRGQYVACLQYKKDSDRNSLGLEVQLYGPLSREDAAKLYEDKYYNVKGIMAGFPFQSKVLYPYIMTALENYNKPLVSFGAIKINNAELTLKQ